MKWNLSFAVVCVSMLAACTDNEPASLTPAQLSADWLQVSETQKVTNQTATNEADGLFTHWGDNVGTVGNIELADNSVLNINHLGMTDLADNGTWALEGNTLTLHTKIYYCGVPMYSTKVFTAAVEEGRLVLQNETVVRRFKKQ